MVWRRARTGDPIAGEAELRWSVPAMSQAIQALALVSARDRVAGCSVISDAVWAVTMVDAAMVRRHSSAYDEVLAGERSVDRRLIEETLAGLRFVRNQIPDHAAVAQLVVPTGDAGTAGDESADDLGVTAWRWRAAPTPVSRRGPRAQAWEMGRYHAYQACLVGRSVGEVFDRTEAFLLRTAEAAPLIADLGRRQAVASGAGVHPARPSP
jgi:hypothetical protein